MLANEYLEAVVDHRGWVVSLRDRRSGHELNAPGEPLGVLRVHPDTPGEYDAWELDADVERVGAELHDVDEIVHSGDDGARTIEVVRSFGHSRFRQRYTLRAGVAALEFHTHVDWAESRKLLKLAFALDVKAESVSFGTQFGYLDRPAVRNTSWDRAKFEVPAHRFAWIGMPGQGIAVCNDAIYGHDVSRHTRDGGGSTIEVGLSLLRSPRFPDPTTDQGEHAFAVSLSSADGIADAMREADRLEGLSIEPIPPAARLVSSMDPGIVVSAVKLADDRSGDVVVRFHEALGERGRARLGLHFPAGKVRRVDLLERELPGSPVCLDGAELSLDIRPFELVTLRLSKHGNSTY
ncbi:MAG: alpha-mannosidase [Labilithrix sp.]|nr:alpha-mannosidase [Labilithrix sp.]